MKTTNLKKTLVAICVLALLVSMLSASAFAEEIIEIPDSDYLYVNGESKVLTVDGELSGLLRLIVEAPGKLHILSSGVDVTLVLFDEAADEVLDVYSSHNGLMDIPFDAAPGSYLLGISGSGEVEVLVADETETEAIYSTEEAAPAEESAEPEVPAEDVAEESAETPVEVTAEEPAPVSVEAPSYDPSVPIVYQATLNETVSVLDILRNAGVTVEAVTYVSGNTEGTIISSASSVVLGDWLLTPYMPFDSIELSVRTFEDVTYTLVITCPASGQEVEAPAEIPAEESAEAPVAEAQVEEPAAEAAAEADAEAPVDVVPAEPAEAPAEEAPAEEPVEAPAEEVAAEEPAEVPAEQPEKEQGFLTGFVNWLVGTPSAETSEDEAEAPADEATDEPAEEATEAPVAESVEASADESAEEPAAETAAEADAEAPADEAVEEPAEVPAEEAVIALEDEALTPAEPAPVSRQVTNNETLSLLSVLAEAEIPANVITNVSGEVEGVAVLNQSNGDWLITPYTYFDNLTLVITATDYLAEDPAAAEAAYTVILTNPAPASAEEPAEPVEDTATEAPSDEAVEAPSDDAEAEVAEVPAEASPAIDVTIAVERGEDKAIRLFAENITEEEKDNYSYQWQYSLDNETWLDVEGATDKDYTFLLDETNGQYYWRLIVSCN